MGTESEAKIAIFCPYCKGQHIDEGRYAIKPHKQHLCFHCGRKFRLSKATIGVRGSKNKILDEH